ncbi:MAG: ferredoxin [Proteobacteria bacterium]|nr:ferredoxin [Pseudomonadota bacterium]
MKVQVLSEVCTGHGRCYMLAPEVFGEDDRGHCQVLAPEVPSEHESQARIGAEACPEQAIEIEE